MSETIKVSPNPIQSGDQSFGMSWDPHIKLRGLRQNGVPNHVMHQFHLADALGRSSEGRSDPHVSTEYYALRDGREIQPSWFAVSEALPALPLLSLNPSKLADFVDTKFATFAQQAEAAFATLSNEERASINNALVEMGYPMRLPKHTNEIYRQLTEGNWLGVMDGGEKSSSSLTFDEIADAQRTLYTRLYHQIAPLLPRGTAREQLRQRLEQLVGPESTTYQAALGKSLPDAARAIFDEVSPKLDKMTGVQLDNISLHETTETFQLPKPHEAVDARDADRFRFADWYLKPENRALYNAAHNSVADELSKKKGENPIQSIPTTKGETPLWVIIDGRKYKLHIVEDKVSIVGREGNNVVEETVPVDHQVTNHQELAAALYKLHPDKDISLMPTAIGLMLHLRANGDVLLPEQGSHYVDQVNMVWNRMQELALPHQLDAIQQHNILRVHPNGIAALPDNIQIRLPWYLTDGFKVDRDGLTNTSDIKKHWKEVLERHKTTLQQAAAARTLTERAELLFRGKTAPLVESLVRTLTTSDAQEEELKKRMGILGGEIRAAAQKEELRYLGQVSSYARGDLESLNVPDSFLRGNEAELESIRQGYLALREVLQKKPAYELVLKYLVTLRARELQGGIDALEYHNARPSLLTLYALFGERGVKDVVQATTAYTEETPQAMHSEVYDAEGNKILVVRDFNGKIVKDNGYAQTIGQHLQTLNFDTAMVLVPTDKKGADFAVVVVGKDGSVGGMCGNGVRAVGKYAHDYLGKDEIRLLTDSGEIVRGYKDGNNYSARLSEIVELTGTTTDRFAPYLHTTLQQAEDPTQTIRDMARLNHDQFYIQGVRQILTEPHLVVTTVGNPDKEAMRAVAQRITGLKAADDTPVFPQSINVNFLSQTADGSYQLSTYERGGVDDFTGSCGTGSVCTASILFERTGQNSVAFTETNGGLNVRYQDGHYHLSGSVRTDN